VTAQAELFDAPVQQLPTPHREGTDLPEDMAVQCRDCAFWKTTEAETYFRAMTGVCKHHGKIDGWWTCGQWRAK